MKRRPEHVILAQEQLLKRVLTPEFEKLFNKGICDFLDHRVGKDKWSQKIYDDTVEPLVNNFSDILINGESVFVTSDTARLIDYAAKQWPIDEAYDVTAPLYDNAFILFEEPVDMGFWRGTGAPEWVNQFGISWIGMRKTLYQDVDKEADLYYIGLARRNAVDIVPTMTMTIVAADEKLYMGEVGIYDNIPTGEALFNPAPVLMAMWSLFRQPIIAERKERPTRPDIRKRRKKENRELAVRVMEVRQRVYTGQSNGSTSSRTYTHRWVVRGHWKMQAHGKGRMERKRIWIDMHTAGPDGAPLKTGHIVRKA